MPAGEVVMIQLAIIGFLEALVYLLRYRSANERSSVRSGIHTFMVTALRVWFIVAGFSALFNDQPWWSLILAYAIPAAVTTAVFHECLERRKASKQ